MYNSSVIAERIKATAKEKKISVKELLSDTGLGQNTMANMKTSMPKSDNLAKIADCLGCSVDYLLGRADAPLSTYGDGFTPHDKALVEAYKKQPAVQQAVDKLLNLDTLSFSLYSASAHIPEEIAAYGGSQTRGEQPPVNPQITPPQKKRG